MAKPALHFFLPGVADFLSLYAFSQSCSAPGWQPPFHFPKGDAKAQACDLLANRFGLAFFMDSLAICCHQKHAQAASHRVGACVAEACWELGSPWASWGNPWARCSRRPCWALSGGLLDGVCDAVRLLPFNAFQESFLLLSLLFSAPLLPAMQLTIQSSGWGGREMSLFGSIPHSWGSWVLTYMLLLPLQEKWKAEKFSLGPKLCCVQGGVMWVKPSCSSYLIPCTQKHIFLLQLCAGTSFLEIWTSTKAISQECFLGAPRQCLRGVGVGT